jgi:hypothetical protein
MSVRASGPSTRTRTKELNSSCYRRQQESGGRSGARVDGMSYMCITLGLYVHVYMYLASVSS